jgi:hypothetical protein
MRARMLLLGTMAATAIVPATAGAQATPGTIAYGQEGGSEYPETVNVIASGGGGSPTMLAPGEFPSISPDGQTVAYVYVVNITGDAQLRTVPSAGGTPTQVAGISPTVAPAWSPNSSQLSYLASGGLWIVNATGGTPKLVVKQSSTTTLGASAFLSSSKLIYLQATPGGHSVLPSYGVRTISTSGSGSKAVKIKVPAGWQIAGTSLSVSASKSTIAFSMRKQNTFGIGIAPVAGGKAKLVSGYAEATFAPTGSQLCGQAGGLGPGALSIISTSGSVVSSLGVTGTSCTWGS